MDRILSPEQNAQLPYLIVEILRSRGQTVVDLGSKMDRGDPRQKEHAGLAVWHAKSSIDDQVARTLRLPPSLHGPGRETNNLPIQTRRTLAKLGKQGIVAIWNPKRASLFRLVDFGRQPVPKPRTGTPARPNMDTGTLFMTIVSQSGKDNTYKFVLGKILLDYCMDSAPESGRHEISYDYLAGEFFRHYWHQKYRFKMKQDFHTHGRGPVAMQILEDVFGQDPPGKFEDLDQAKVEKAKQTMLRRVLASASSYKGNVLHRFQRIGRGDGMYDGTDIYNNNEDKKTITLKPEVHAFLRQNYIWLERALLSEWASYLERANPGLPRLVSKLSRLDANPEPAKYRADFLRTEESPRCFYCKRGLEPKLARMDHFIPWPYMFDYHAWNLVTACRECNRAKGDLLASAKLVDRLIERNNLCAKTMQIMRMSLSRLSPGGDWEGTIRGHYAMCGGFGFGKWAP